MSFLSKLKFWHKDETGLGDFKLDEPATDSLQPSSGSKPLPTFEQSMSMQGVDKFSAASGGGLSSQDLQLISSKLDTLIAKMDNMNQRIANLERIAGDVQR